MPAPCRSGAIPQSGFPACWIADARESSARKYRQRKVSLLAEKVETQQELEEARHLGFSYFQGYFFCKPSMIETREIPGNKLHPASTAQRRCRSRDSTIAAIEELFKREPSLLYRLLRYLNSPVLGLRIGNPQRSPRTFPSRRTRISPLGLRLRGRGYERGKPPELVRTALTRAYFCEEFLRRRGIDKLKDPASFSWACSPSPMPCWTSPSNEVLSSSPSPGSQNRSLRRRKRFPRSLRLAPLASSAPNGRSLLGSRPPPGLQRRKRFPAPTNPPSRKLPPRVCKHPTATSKNKICHPERSEGPAFLAAPISIFFSNFTLLSPSGGIVPHSFLCVHAGHRHSRPSHALIPRLPFPRPRCSPQFVRTIHQCASSQFHN